SPSRAAAIETGSGRLTYSALISNLLYSLVPFLIVGGTFALIWWYVVIHQEKAPEEAYEGLQQLGAPVAPSSAPVDDGPPKAFYWWFAGIAIVCLLWQVKYYLKLNADRLEVIKLLSTSIMPLGILTVVVLAVILFGI